MRQLTTLLFNRLRYSSFLAPMCCILPLLTFGGAISPALAQAETPILLSLEMPPASGSAPQRTAGAGLRGNPGCIETHPDPTLIALVPDDPVSLTLSAQPKFFVYIPPNTAQEGIFSLALSPNGYGDYTEKVILSGDPGVIEISIPEEVSLKLDQDYAWKFTLLCQDAGNSQTEASNAVVQGKVRRISATPELQARLNAIEGNSLARADLYAREGVWHEATEILYGLRGSAPQQWTEWLGSVQLDSLASQPSIVDGSPTLF